MLINNSNQKAGLWQAIAVILLNQLPMMAIVALMPALPEMISHFKDVENKELLVPMILTAPGICIALISPLAGTLVDKFGRRKLLIIFTFLYAIGGILPFFLNSFNSIITGRLILGIGETFVLVIGNTLIGDYFHQKDRSKWLMIQGFFGSIAASLLLSLSGFLTNQGWNYPFLVYGICFIIGLFVIFFIFEPQEKFKSEIDEISSGEKFPLSAAISVFIYTLGFSLIYFVYTIHFSRALNGMGITDNIQIGNLSAIASTAVPVGALIFKLVSKYAPWKQMALIFLLFSIGLIGIGLSKDPTTAVIVGWIQQLGCGMTIPVLIAWGLNRFPVQYRGRGMGFWTSAFFLGQFLNPAFVSLFSSFSGGILETFQLVGILCGFIFLGIVTFSLFIKKTV